MGELDDSAQEDPCRHPSPTAPGPHRPWTVRARHELTEERILEEVGGSEGRHAERVLEVHETMRQRARLHARQLRQLATFFDLPRMFVHLEAGDLPEDHHRFLLRQVRRLDAEQIRLVDEHLAGVEIPSIPRSTFEAQVRLAVASVGNALKLPREAREVRIDGVDPEQGVARLTLTGPNPEIRSLALRLDSSARAVQHAQRVALETDDETPVPFDIDGDVRDRERPLGLATLRYAILARTVLDLDPVEETAQPFTILVTVPMTTLLGIDDSPAVLDGLTPIPAEVARDLAATSSVWYRILTDPICGTHLPVRSDNYRPDAQMRLQLKLRHPVCAALDALVPRRSPRRTTTSSSTTTSTLPAEAPPPSGTCIGCVDDTTSSRPQGCSTPSGTPGTTPRAGTSPPAPSR